MLGTFNMFHIRECGWAGDSMHFDVNNLLYHRVLFDMDTDIFFHSQVRICLGKGSAKYSGVILGSIDDWANNIPSDKQTKGNSNFIEGYYIHDAEGKDDCKI